MEILKITEENIPSAAVLAADFRVTLKGYKGIVSRPDAEAAQEELREYLDAGWPCFGAVEDGKWAGYVVCRVDEPCVWVEALYVTPEFRRRGIASALMAQTEKIAAAYGEETVFNYVHPNNHGMIAFLRRHGYTVLNLIEIRKPYRDEKFVGKINVGENQFDY